jgi:hypothetical protein
MSYFRRMSSPQEEATDTPFEIVPWTGEQEGYMVSNGVCFSTFSYNTGSFVPIKGLNTRFDFNGNEKIYIDFTILPNLQVSGAEIKCTKVGAELGPVSNQNNPTRWNSYPDMFWINPKDEMDSSGRVKKLVDGKRQIKCYSLIGYRSDDTNKNGGTNPPPPDTGSFSAVQILNTDIILLASIFSGVPVVFPSPYLGGTNHLNSLVTPTNEL